MRSAGRRSLAGGRLGRRVASAAVLLALLGVALWVEGPFLYVFLGVVVAVGLWELSGLLQQIGAPPPPWVLYPLGLWLLYQYVLPPEVPVLDWGLGLAVVAGLIGGLVMRPPQMVRWVAAVGGAVYIGLSIGFLVGVLRLTGSASHAYAHFGLRAVGVTLASAFAGDTAAFFTGSAAGRHSFFPSISPNKTVEGALGGGLATVLVWLIAAPLGFGLAWYHALIVGMLVAVASQGGDLVESSLKRAAGVKDSSSLIPGHGGLLDRMDSVVLLGPVVYCYLRLLGL
ncbi:MAG: phosphatidate cytidylyltransferase [Chloroflexi bacterium]|nr:MAG: phosphatidate cytidylyltransferase [Chloroflexota bacterium]